MNSDPTPIRAQVKCWSIPKFAKIMPPKGQKAKRGGKRQSGGKSPTKKPADSEPSELDLSLRPEGVGASVSHVCMYNMENHKFEVYPAKGYSGETVLEATGIDPSSSLTREERLKEVEVKLTPSVGYKVKIFLRFQAGK